VTLHADALAVVTAWAPPAAAGVEIRNRTLDLLAQGAGVMGRAHQTGHITASAMIVHEDRQRVLLCLHGRFHMWCQLGGHCEDGDRTVVAAALREATEESGISGLIIDPDPIGVDIHAVTCSGGASHHFDVRFAMLAPAGAAEAVSAESRALGWFYPHQLPTPLADATEELIAPALARFAR
jgi:8-oxo-dGTP pyrophosphatase MutT (NUDIX family)